MENLIALTAALAAATSDRRNMERTEIQRWANMYRAFLVIERGATLDEVFKVANDWIGDSRFFPTVADLAPAVEQLVSERHHREESARAQDAAVPVPELPAPTNQDHTNTRTADLPPGYDYSTDPYWLRGIELMDTATITKADLGPIGNMARQMAQRFEENQAIGFQGASKPRELTGPACNGSRYLRLGGWDGHPDDIGKASSRYVMCRVCCPHGEYSERAERDAARKAAV